KCRDVFRAWPEYAKRFANASWAVHMIFATLDDREELIRQKEWTAAEARREVRRRRGEGGRRQEGERRRRGGGRGGGRVETSAASSAAQPPGSPLSSWGRPDPDPNFDHFYGDEKYYIGEDDSGEGDSGFEVESEDEEGYEELDATAPWLFAKGNKKVGKKVL